MEPLSEGRVDDVVVRLKLCSFLGILPDDLRSYIDDMSGAEVDQHLEVATQMILELSYVAGYLRGRAGQVHGELLGGDMGHEPSDALGVEMRNRAISVYGEPGGNGDAD